MMWLERCFWQAADLMLWRWRDDAMTIYVAFLRGINVGGHKKISMAELRTMFESIGLNQVQTYIQSGNVLFASPEDAKFLRDQIEQEIERVFSFDVTVVLRSSSELERIISHCPFPESVRKEAEDATDVETFYVSLFLEPPPVEALEKLQEYTSATDEFRVQDREVYLLVREGIRNSKLANQLSRLNIPSTARNWKTMNKLNTLAETMKLQK
jgi:uncharacterized protein (DUF1697 family)